MMALRIKPTCSSYTSSSSTSPSLTLSSVSRLGRLHDGGSMGKGNRDMFRLQISGIRGSQHVVTRASSGGGLGGRWEEWWKPREKLKLLPDSIPCLSDILWPSAGAFASMALLARLDQMVAPWGFSFTIAPLGAVCAVLFATPNSPAAQKYNMFMAQIGCAAIGVVALMLFGPGWLARGAALAASIAFMIVAGASHPPAASLPILFIDGAKFHRLNIWYALFPGAVGCLILCLIQEMVTYLKKNCKF